MSKKYQDQDDLRYVRDLPGFERSEPIYFDQGVIDHLIGIVLELGAELWIVKDRLAFIEELLENHGAITAETLERERPSEVLQNELKAERQAFIQRIYGRLYAQYGGDQAAAATAPMSRKERGPAGA